MEKAIDPESLCSMDSSELLIRFQPLMEGEVRRYAAIIGRVASGVEDDLRQCAALGFLSALSSFDPKRSPAFIPYVRNGIGMAIRKEISDNLRMIRQPKGTLEKARVLRRAYAEAAAEGIDIADDAEMMRLTGFSPLVLRNARRSLEREEMMELDSLPGDIAAEASHEDEVIKGMMVEELETDVIIFEGKYLLSGDRGRVFLSYVSDLCDQETVDEYAFVVPSDAGASLVSRMVPALKVGESGKNWVSRHTACRGP